MHTLYRVLLEIHVASGTLALVAFWVAIALPKGGARHRRAGLTFVASMGLAAALAAVLATAVLIEPAIREGALRGLFAGLLVAALATLTLLGSGVRAVRRRRTHPAGWVVRHLVGVLGASVIGHTAFFVSMVPRLVPGIYARDATLNLLPWVVPPLVGTALVVLACRRYAPHFEAWPRATRGRASAPLH